MSFLYTSRLQTSLDQHINQGDPEISRVGSRAPWLKTVTIADWLGTLTVGHVDVIDDDLVVVLRGPEQLAAAAVNDVVAWRLLRSTWVPKCGGHLQQRAVLIGHRQ